MFRRLPIFLISIAVLTLVACGNQEEATPTTAPDTATSEPTETQPEPTPTPSQIPATNTPEPTMTHEPETAGTGATVSPVGYWEGAIATSGVEILINVEFNSGDDGLSGTIDIPQQGAADLPLENITLDGDQIHFEIAGVGAVFDGLVTTESVAGDFEQGAATGTFELTAAERVEDETTDAVADLPYNVEEVMWEIDDTTVIATLTRPEGDDPFPAIIMVAGSGPTDRDWNSPLLPGTNGSAALFADALTRAGYVTLRYDKRVTGPNAATNIEKLMGKLSLQSHLDELAGGVALLADHEVVDASRIFALANSEGAIHALNYQRQAADMPFAGPPLAGLILAAPPGRTLLDVMRTQIEPQLEGANDPEAKLALYDEAIERFLAGEAMEPSPDLPEGIQQLLLGLEAPTNLPFTREMFVVDPAAWLTEIDVPVLVLIGKKDLQIDWEIDGDRLEEAVKGSETVRFVYPDNANHVFKYEEKPANELTAADGVHYNSADRVLDDESMSTILAWLKETLLPSSISKPGPPICPDLPRPAMVFEAKNSEDYILRHVASRSECTMQFDPPIYRLLALTANGVLYSTRVNGEESTDQKYLHYANDGTLSGLPFFDVDDNVRYFVISSSGSQVAWSLLRTAKTTEGQEIVVSELYSAKADGSKVRLLHSVDNTAEVKRGEPYIAWIIQPLRFVDDSDLLFAVQSDGGGGAWNGISGRYSNLYQMSMSGGDTTLVYECPLDDYTNCIGDISADSAHFAVTKREADDITVFRMDGTPVTAYSGPGQDYIGHPIFGPTGDLVFMSADVSEDHITIQQAYMSLVTKPYENAATTLLREPLSFVWDWVDEQHVLYTAVEDEQTQAFSLSLVKLDGGVERLPKTYGRFRGVLP